LTRSTGKNWFVITLERGKRMDIPASAYPVTTFIIGGVLVNFLNWMTDSADEVSWLSPFSKNLIILTIIGLMATYLFSPQSWIMDALWGAVAGEVILGMGLGTYIRRKYTRQPR
jgi:hypothetical protein